MQTGDDEFQMPISINETPGVEEVQCKPLHCEEDITIKEHDIDTGELIAMNVMTNMAQFKGYVTVKLNNNVYIDSIESSNLNAENIFSKSITSKNIKSKNINIKTNTTTNVIRKNNSERNTIKAIHTASFHHLQANSIFGTNLKCRNIKCKTLTYNKFIGNSLTIDKIMRVNLNVNNINVTNNFNVTNNCTTESTLINNLSTGKINNLVKTTVKTAVVKQKTTTDVLACEGTVNSTCTLMNLNRAFLGSWSGQYNRRMLQCNKIVCIEFVCPSIRSKIATLNSTSSQNANCKTLKLNEKITVDEIKIDTMKINNKTLNLNVEPVNDTDSRYINEPTKSTYKTIRIEDTSEDGMPKKMFGTNFGFAIHPENNVFVSGECHHIKHHKGIPSSGTNIRILDINMKRWYGKDVVHYIPYDNVNPLLKSYRTMSVSTNTCPIKNTPTAKTQTIHEPELKLLPVTYDLLNIKNAFGHPIFCMGMASKQAVQNECNKHDKCSAIAFYHKTPEKCWSLYSGDEASTKQQRDYLIYWKATGYI